MIGNDDSLQARKPVVTRDVHLGEMGNASSLVEKEADTQPVETGEPGVGL